jgi:uncharacterized protein YceH (UPF0502 family)
MPEPLSAIERRVLGVLVEKALTAAAPEPLTLNAIVTGSNQKSNRDPLMSLEEPETDSALESLQRKGLVFRITGGRVERWRHNLYDAWQVSKPELAVLAELLLRGPQTAAEARARASRMEPLDQDTATSTIKALVDRGFIVWLTPEHRRGALLTHGLYPPDELERLRSSQGGAGAVTAVVSQGPAAPLATPASPSLSGEIAALRTEVQELRSQIAALQEALGLRAQKTPPT